MTDVNWSTTLIGYAVLGGATVAYFWPQINRNLFAGNTRTQGQQEAAPARSRRQDNAAGLSGDRQKGSLKSKGKQVRPKKVASSTGLSEAQPPTDIQGSNEEDADTTWAHQLANVQKGTNLTRKSQEEKQNKSVKQSKALQTPEASVSGGEVDDDTPVPQAGAASHSNSVADMLEPKAAGPSVLRVAPKEEKARAVEENGWDIATRKERSKPETTSITNDVETKKQRQNRQKAEERKALREQDEEARRILMEKQRRTAREARGEPARNGVSVAPPVNSWTSGKVNGTTIGSHVNTIDPHTQSTTPGNSQMFDTFDAGSSASNLNGNGPSSQPSAHAWQEHELPSEEEQMRILQEQDESAWNTVQDKRKLKKQKSEDRARVAAASAASKAPSSIGDSDEPAPAVQPIATSNAPDDGGWSVV